MKNAVRVAHEDRFSTMAKQVTQWVDQILGPSYHKYCPGQTWTPAINVYEDQTSYCLVVDLAGASPEDIDLRPDKEMLVLSGNRSAPSMPHPAGKATVHHMEIDHGRFCRVIPMPKDANLEQVELISANYKCGFLWIRIPKKSLR